MCISVRAEWTCSGVVIPLPDAGYGSRNRVVCFTATGLPAKPPKPWAEPWWSLEEPSLNLLTVFSWAPAAQHRKQPGALAVPLALQGLSRCCRSSETAKKSFEKCWVLVLPSMTQVAGWWAGSQLGRGRAQTLQRKPSTCTGTARGKEATHTRAVRDKPVLGVNAWSLPVTGTAGSGGGTAAIPEVTLGLWKGCAVPPSWCSAEFWMYPLAFCAVWTLGSARCWNTERWGSEGTEPPKGSEWKF